MTLDFQTYRARVGLFDPSCQKKQTKSKIRKNPTMLESTNYVKNSKAFSNLLTILIMLDLCREKQQGKNNNEVMLRLTQVHRKVILCIMIVYIYFLILLCGDVHVNPGPINTCTTELPCYFLNARSIKKIATHQYKIREFKELMYTINPALIGISETWLNDNIKNDHVISETEYTFHRKDREEQKGGGVLCLVKNSIKSDHRKELQSQELEHNEIIVVEVEPSPGNKIMVIVAYRSQQDPYHLFLNNLETALINCVRANLTNIVLIEDFNYSSIKWDINEDTNLPPHCLEFMSTLERFGLIQLNHYPSRRENNNILDLILTNNVTQISPIYSDLFSYSSDHFLLHFDLTTTLDKVINIPRKVLNFNRANYNQLHIDIAQADLLTSVVNKPNINSKLTVWCDKLLTIIHNNIPQIIIGKGHSQPWVDHEALTQIKKKDRALKQAKIHKNNFHWTKFKQLRNSLKNLMSVKHASYILTMCNSITTNPKKFWTYLKTQTKSRGIPTFLRSTNDDKITTSIGMSTAFNKFFQSTFTPITNKTPPHIVEHLDPNLHDIIFETNEIEKQLQGLNPSKAPGPDNLPTKILKDFAHDLAPSITTLFNSSISEGTVPSAWKHANVIPLHKKGDKHTTSNYRPISLLPVISKVLERCIYNRIIDFILPKLTNLQHGFLRNRSTATQLLTVFSKINNILDTGNQADVVYFDLSKAFDSVPHKFLIHKLKSFGFHGNLLAWLSNYLSNRFQRVSFNGSASEWLPVTSGVPQGSILGPLLFLIYINDLPTVLSPNTLCAIFADDTKIYRNIESHQDHLILQLDINKVHNWSQLWGLTFNKNKCNIITLKRSSNSTEFIYSMDNTALKRTNTVMDLGVKIHTLLRWNDHINSIISKANQRLWITIRTIGFNAPLKTKILTYVALCRSILEYNTVMWSPSTKDNILKIESLQRQATNFFTNNPKRPSPLHVEYRERLLHCNLLPLTYRREFYDIIFFIKSLRGLIAFNILEFVSFQVDNQHRVTRNRAHGLNLTYTNSRLESSAHFYPIRIARLWNALTLELRLTLTSPIPLSQIKSTLTRFYKDRLSNIFDTDNTCTWVMACRCRLCKP